MDEVLFKSFIKLKVKELKNDRNWFKDKTEKRDWNLQ
jgi:hypothetical protein